MQFTMKGMLPFSDVVTMLKFKSIQKSQLGAKPDCALDPKIRYMYMYENK